MIHTSYWRPRVYPFEGDVAPAQIDRIQDLSATVTLNRERVREVGRDGTVDWRKRIPSTRLTMRQLEYGDIEFYQKIANKVGSDTDITLADFKTSMVDIVGYKTDDDGTFKGSVWYPKYRTAGFSINIGDPQAMIERSFDFVGEDENVLEGSNQYFNYQRFPCVTPGATETFTVNSPSPVADPDNSGRYLFRVVEVSAAGVTTELEYGTGTGQYTFTAPSTLTVRNTTAGDVYKVYYSAATWNSQTQGANIFTNNDTDAGALLAESASIYLYVAADNYVYKLQSVGIDVSFDRQDNYEIGNDEVVQRGVRDKTVRVTLGRILDTYTIEEVMRGKTSAYGRLNTREYLDNITLRVKMYGNSAKTSFNLGLKLTNLSPTGLDAGVPLNDYATRGVTLEGEDLTISNVEATINA